MSGEKDLVVVVGGTAGIGRAIAEAYAGRGVAVTIVGSSAARAEEAAAGLGSDARGLEADLAKPAEIPDRLASVGRVSRLVLTAVSPNQNSVDAFEAESGARVTTIKLVGYPAVVAALRDRLAPDGSIVMFGGNSKDKPYPGSTSLTPANAGVAALARSLALELAPVRVNAIHPGVVVDTPTWHDAPPDFLESVRDATPTGDFVRIADVLEATLFLLEGRAITGQNLAVDGGSGL